MTLAVVAVATGETKIYKNYGKFQKKNCQQPLEFNSLNKKQGVSD